MIRPHSIIALLRTIFVPGSVFVESGDLAPDSATACVLIRPSVSWQYKRLSWPADGAYDGREMSKTSPI
jgi:hypothetical protein